VRAARTLYSHKKKAVFFGGCAYFLAGYLRKRQRYVRRAVSEFMCVAMLIYSVSTVRWRVNLASSKWTRKLECDV
jgi:hypothetical protein